MINFDSGTQNSWCYMQDRLSLVLPKSNVNSSSWKIEIYLMIIELWNLRSIWILNQHWCFSISRLFKTIICINSGFAGHGFYSFQVTMILKFLVLTTMKTYLRPCNRWYFLRWVSNTKSLSFIFNMPIIVFSHWTV